MFLSQCSCDVKVPHPEMTPQMAFIGFFAQTASSLEFDFGMSLRDLKLSLQE